MPKFHLGRPKIYLRPMKNADEITQTERLAMEEIVYRIGARECVIVGDENEIGL